MRDLLGFLGLAKRSGRLVAGIEAVHDAGAVAKLICVAQDLSPGSLKRAYRAAEKGNVRLITLSYTKEELGRALGRMSCGILALTDEGFASVVIGAVGNHADG